MDVNVDDARKFLEDFRYKQACQMKLACHWLECPESWRNFITPLDLQDAGNDERNKLIDEALVEFHATRIPGKILVFETPAHKTYFIMRWS